MSQLTAVDYVVFILVLLISLAIGVYYACSGGRQKTNEEYLRGNRRIGMLPTSLSILVSFFSAILITGLPAEIYMYGPKYTISNIGMALGAIVAGMIFVPFFYRLQLLSAYEYLELRFQHRSARLLGSGLNLVSTFLYIAVCLYAPALSLNTMSAMPIWASILLVGGIGTVYTSIGGIKAVVWTDVFQAGIMMAGILVIAIQGTINAGGWDRVWATSSQGGRLDMSGFFTVDPTVRMTFWTSIIGMGIQCTNMYGVNQASVQRFCATSSLRIAVGSMMLIVPFLLVMIFAVSYCGLVIFANYAGCDPKLAGEITNHNQLVPFFVVSSMGFLQGVPGLFIASLFSGALSSTSSSLTSMAANLWGDFLLMVPAVRRLPEKYHVVTTKLIAVIFGILTMLLALMVQSLSGPLTQIALTAVSTTGGPSFGLFLLGMLVPFANWKGALAGCIGSLSLSLWLIVGGQIMNTPPPILPLTNSTCPTNVTLVTAATTAMSMLSGTTPAPVTPVSSIRRFYSISFLWYTTYGLVNTLLIGIVVSLLTGGFEHKQISSRLFIQIGSCLPASWMKPYVFGNDSIEPRLVSCSPEETDVKRVKLMQVRPAPATTGLSADDDILPVRF